MTNDYSDIINLPHPEPKNRQRMPMQARASQFAPFAALTGHDAAIAETARQTEKEIDLCEDDQIMLNRKIAILLENLHLHPHVTFTYFLPDDKKEGGKYLSVDGVVSKFDDYAQLLYLDNGSRIPVQRIFEMESEIFDKK